MLFDSKMSREVYCQKRRIDKEERKSRKQEQRKAHTRTTTLETNRELALKFVEWATRAEIAPQALNPENSPSRVRNNTRKHKKLEGWMISQNFKYSSEAITTKGRYISINENYSVMEITRPLVYIDIAKFIAAHRPDVPWVSPS